jgi:hypothetical protein
VSTVASTDARTNEEVALAMLRICPACAGLCKQPYNGDWSDPNTEMVPCNRCGGTGDLLGWILHNAYMAGFEDAVGDIGHIVSRLAEQLNYADPLSQREMRSRVGLRT